MIKAQQLALRRGTKLLFEDASFAIHAGEKIGVIGANGCGKSSLFGLLLGEHSIDSGSLDIPSQWTIAIMRQEAASSHRSALEYVQQGDTQIAELQAAQHAAEQRQDNKTLARIVGELDTLQAYNLETRASQLLAGLGFASEQFSREVNAFSGGWRIRLNLARTLMRRADLLLLDEPTNHLDIDAVTWLESWLARYPGTLLMISHDRDFLDSVTSRTLHFESSQLQLYNGNFSAAEQQRVARLEQQQALFEKQQARIQDIENFVRRFRAKASKAKQAQSRLKELERLERVSAAYVESPYRFSLPCHAKMSDPLLKIREAQLGHGETMILDEVSFSIRPGDRIGILGPNGAGKTTLLKTLANKLPLIRGERVIGDHARIGYFAQHQLEALDLQASPLLHLQRLDKTMQQRAGSSALTSDQELRNFLGSFGFGLEATADTIEHFSGGEKARLALAIIAWEKPNILLLDEPTNHLDMEMRHALLLAIQEYAGAVILVSHDRHLIRNCVDELVVVNHGMVKILQGDLQDYQTMLRKQLADAGSNDNSSNDTSGSGKKALRQQAAAQRKQLQPLRNAVKKTDQQLGQVSAELSDLEQQLTDTSLYSSDNTKKLQALLKQQGEQRQHKERLEQLWLDQQDELEQAEQGQ